MKYILGLIFTSLFLLSGCSQPLSLSPKERIVDISDATTYHSVGKGVIVDSATLMTAAHVYRACERQGCRFLTHSFGDISLAGSHSIDDREDTAYLGISLQNTKGVEYAKTPLLDISLFALVSRSGSWEREEGKILDLNASYIGYDNLLSGAVYTGAIQTDIVLEPGESGTPVWTFSGELVGIMVASDMKTGRGYIKP